MRYEVEMKFPASDMAAIERRLSGMGAAISAEISEIDTYFAHPARDFAKTDEALRLRRKDNSFFITYKGPKIEAATKTRREIEIPLSGDEAAFQSWYALLAALGFAVVGEVRKRRRKAQAIWQGRGVEVSLDEVAPLGTFVELELVAEEDGIEAAKSCIAALAHSLGLEGGERRSYLELLAAAGAVIPAGTDSSSA